MAVQRGSVSFDPQNWKRLSRSSNKSKVVNDALRLYFMMETLRAEQECEWSEKEITVLKKEWDHYKKSGESYGYDETFDRNL